MPSIDLESPVGRLALVEEGGSLVRVSWAAAERPAPTPLLARARAQLAAYFAGELTAFELPLAPAGSPFQRRVWRLMAEIPYGVTWTYGEMARRLGTAPRAVGGACARNPIPIILPCHRVVGGGGRLTGYSGADGLATKDFLLRLEGAVLL